MSFSLHGSVLEEMSSVMDVHIASLRPGGIRGNHFHAVKNEVITVAYADRWSFYWDTGEGTQVQRRQFAGTGAVAINVPPAWSHAVRNEGTAELWLFNASDAPYRRETGAVADSYRRVVVR